MSIKKLSFALLFLTACGGGGGSDSSTNVTFEGTLVQGAESARLAHDAGEAIDGVQVCALGECSTTDGNGQWGFGVESAPTEILFSVTGHEINSSWTVNIPANAKNITIELENHSDGVHPHTVIADGQVVSQSGTHDHNHG